jgi:IS30 family transposase
MAKLNYAQVEVAIRNLENFEGNSCFGQWLGDVYLITSYQTTIARVERFTNGVVVSRLDSKYYSKTTSRLQNIIKKVWELR